MEKKIEKKFFGSEIIAFELVALNTRFYWESILIIGCQYANKESQDFRYFWKSVFQADFYLRVIKKYNENIPVWI